MGKGEVKEGVSTEEAIYMKPYRFEQAVFTENEIREVNKGKTMKGTVY